MMNWVENVSSSIPDHSIDVRNTLIRIMKTQNLDEIDAHACALAAALVSGNGELGFAIEMFGPLQRAKSEINMAKSAATSANMHNIFNEFVQTVGYNELSNTLDNTITFPGLEIKFIMYLLAASVISHNSQVSGYFTKLIDSGVTVGAIKDIVTIAAVINTIGKIAPEVDQLIPSKF